MGGAGGRKGGGQESRCEQAESFSFSSCAPPSIYSLWRPRYPVALRTYSASCCSSAPPPGTSRDGGARPYSSQRSTVVRLPRSASSPSSAPLPAASCGATQSGTWLTRSAYLLRFGRLIPPPPFPSPSRLSPLIALHSTGRLSLPLPCHHPFAALPLPLHSPLHGPSPPLPLSPFPPKLLPGASSSGTSHHICRLDPLGSLKEEGRSVPSFAFFLCVVFRITAGRSWNCHQWRGTFTTCNTNSAR